MINFEKYYKEYLELHQHWATRYLHCVGNVATISFMLVILTSNLSWLWLLLAPLVVYPFAWSGHFFFEKNKPAAFSSPWYAKLADWRMMWDLFRGKLK